MKISENYMIAEVIDSTVAIPIGQNVADMNKVLSLNPTSAFICECLKEDISLEELLNRMYVKYECNEDEKSIIRNDVNEFLQATKNSGLIVE